MSDDRVISIHNTGHKQTEQGLYLLSELIAGIMVLQGAHGFYKNPFQTREDVENGCRGSESGATAS